MTEVERYEQNGHDQLRESALTLWAQDAQAAHTIAKSLVQTSFVPEAMRGKPHEATAAILTGQEVGLSPMAALRSINLIKGVPALTASAMRGLVQSAGHAVWVEEQTTTRAVVCAQRRGLDKVERVVWTKDRADRLGLMGKQTYRTQPEAMFVARATAEACRRVGADVLLGLPYAVEELDEAAQEEKPRKRKAQRRPLPPVEEPPLEPGKPSDPGQAGPGSEPELEPVATDSGQSGDN